VRALASPASLKGVLAARGAAAAIADGFRRAGAEVDELPVADGGEGTADVLHAALGGEWRRSLVSDPLGRPVEAGWLLLPNGTAVVEAAAAIGLPLVAPAERDPLRATSRGFGELLVAVLEAGHSDLLVGLGGVATIDGGLGMRAMVGDRLREARVVVACDVRNPLLGPRGAARVFGPQKGADAAAVEVLERRLATLEELAPYAGLAGAGAAGGLGAALASLGAELVPGAPLVLKRIGFRARAREATLVVTGEGIVDRTTMAGKAPGEVVRACRRIGVRCILFGGRVLAKPSGAEVRELSGRPRRARADLVRLGEELALLL
jgi:glycerate 2-kinase